MINSDTPNNILTYSVDDVLQFIDGKAENMPSARVRLNYTKMLYDVLGYELTPDVALASASEPVAELVLSTAGGGKTTWSQIKAVEQKIIRKSKYNSKKRIRGTQVLCLVYNNHNVGDMKAKHAQIVHRIMSAGIEGLEIDDSINACTMHSFCDFFRRQFVAKLGLVGFTLSSEDESVGLMQRAINVAAKKLKMPELEDASAAKLLEFHTLSIETLKDISQLQETDLFTDIELDLETITEIFTQFDGVKARSQKYEFIDMIYRVYKLLKTDADALRTVQSYYEYVIADEVQDFTPLMWEMLQLFVSDGTPLTCIGDEDQNLYLFRGADINDTLHFKDRFPEGKIFTLTENRRCRQVILEEAKRVIGENKLRFGKQIVGKLPGGKIETVPYSTMESQIIKLSKMLKNMSADEQGRAVVCYRSLECSQLISEMLAEADIGINCLKAYRPYSHELYVHVTQIFTALQMPCDREAYKNLWKVLPCKKNEFLEAIGYNTKLHRFTKIDDHQHFATIGYGKILAYRGFAEAMQTLADISDKVDTTPMNEIFPTVMRLLNMYFWNFKKSLNKDSELDLIFEKRVEERFCVHKTFEEVLQDIQRVKSICANNTKIGAGVTLSTFHSLKGLEFNTVFAVCLDNDVFPNYPLIEYHGYSPAVEEGLKEAETRLWYVTVTRAIDRLVMMYSEENPSKYVLDYLHRDREKSVTDSCNDSTVGDAIASVSSFDDDDFGDVTTMLDDTVSEQPSEQSSEQPSEQSSEQPQLILKSVNSTQGRTGYLAGLFNSL